MGFYGINFLGVLVAAIAAMLVGMIWYSPNVFGNKWMALAGISKKKMKESKEKGMAKQMVTGFVSQLVMACVLSIFLAYSGAASIPAALVVVFILWLGMIATTQIGSVLWEGKSFELFFLNTLHSLVALAVMAIALQLMG